MPGDEGPEEVTGALLASVNYDFGELVARAEEPA
jgi:hypothetical protein